MKKIFPLYAGLFLLLALLSFNLEPGDKEIYQSIKAEPFDSDCDPDTIYFRQDVLPLLQSNCAMSGCHNEESRKHGVVLNSYESLMATVEMEDEDDDDRRRDDDDRWERDDDSKGRGNGSDRYKNKLEKMIRLNKMPPSADKKLSADQRNLILKWIDQGMRNNSCEISPADCVTENLTFSKDIKPIVDENCVGCHGGAKPRKGYDFSNPGKFREVALTGMVYLAISHSEGAVPMPYEGDKLSDCDISKIKAWIDAGATLE